MRYANPILPGFHPDPTVCRVGEDYYLATSTFEYFPGVPLFHSTNLADWEPIGHALDRDEQLPLEDIDASEGIFAPTLRHHEGTFYLITTNIPAEGNFVVTADDPAGDWSDPIRIDAPGYDPDLCWVDGQALITYANEDAVHQAPVDLETGETGEHTEIWEGLPGGFTEAPHLYEVDGTYYLVTAEGGTHNEHMVSMARSGSPTGPFEDHPDNPVFSHRSEVMQPISATGHADLVQAQDGTWWATFLGTRKQGAHPPYHTLGRESFLAPVTWRDGWPIINDGDLVELEMDVEGTDLEGSGDRAWTRTVDPFDGDAALDGDGRTVGDALGHEWNFRRNPERERYGVEDGTLVLEGGPATLSDRRPTFVGRRQQHHDCRATATLAFDPTGDDEAGLTAIANEDHHYEVAVVDRDGGRHAIARRRVGDLAAVVGETALPGGPVELAIDVADDTYRLEAGPAGGTLERLGAGDARYLSTEIATGFTGVYLGPYATGNGAESDGSARFTDFEYAPTVE